MQIQLNPGNMLMFQQYMLWQMVNQKNADLQQNQMFKSVIMSIQQPYLNPRVEYNQHPHGNSNPGNHQLALMPPVHQHA